jgi:tetratricopeptide (TPR) repeat protein
MRYQKIPYQKRSKTWPVWLAALAVALIAAWLATSPFFPFHSQIAWRVEIARTYLRGIIQPIQAMPTALPAQAMPIDQPTPTPTPTAAAVPIETGTPTALISPTPRPTPTPIPAQVQLPAPPWEKQDINNCGPATLSMYLNFFGWKGDQFTISDVIKPIPQDRNVNIEELLYFTRNYAGWLRSEFRVGGTVELLKQFIAAGLPVVIEESFYFEEYYWPNDDRWAGHYLLVTGYDDATQTFTGQDSFYGANKRIPYTELDRNWQSFNRVYFFAFLPEQEEMVKNLLGEDWDPIENRKRALETARRETQQDPNNGFAWFNLGSNLVYFESYAEAAQAYDRARAAGLPQRMLRYQFGPFFAYFNTGRDADLLALTEYALKITPNAEEALLWHGWAQYRAGNRQKAIESFQKALEARPGYFDAQYALNFVTQN